MNLKRDFHKPISVLGLNEYRHKKYQDLYVQVMKGPDYYWYFTCDLIKELKGKSPRLVSEEEISLLILKYSMIES